MDGSVDRVNGSGVSCRRGAGKRPSTRSGPWFSGGRRVCVASLTRSRGAVRGGHARGHAGGGSGRIGVGAGPATGHARVSGGLQARHPRLCEGTGRAVRSAASPARSAGTTGRATSSSRPSRVRIGSESSSRRPSPLQGSRGASCALWRREGRGSGATPRLGGSCMSNPGARGSVPGARRQGPMGHGIDPREPRRKGNSVAVGGVGAEAAGSPCLDASGPRALRRAARAGARPAVNPAGSPTERMRVCT